VRQETLTVVVRVGTGVHLAQVRTALNALCKDTLPGSGARPRVFAHQRLRIHFSRLVLLDEPHSSEFGPSLVMESNFDACRPESRRANAAAAQRCSPHREPECRLLGLDQ